MMCFILVLLLLLLGDYKAVIHDVDVHLVSLDVFGDVDDSMPDVRPILGTIFLS